MFYGQGFTCVILFADSGFMFYGQGFTCVILFAPQDFASLNGLDG